MRATDPLVPRPNKCTFSEHTTFVHLRQLRTLPLCRRCRGGRLTLVHRWPNGALHGLVTIRNDASPIKKASWIIKRREEISSSTQTSIHFHGTKNVSIPLKLLNAASTFITRKIWGKTLCFAERHFIKQKKYEDITLGTFELAIGVSLSLGVNTWKIVVDLVGFYIQKVAREYKK